MGLLGWLRNRFVEKAEPVSCNGMTLEEIREELDLINTTEEFTSWTGSFTDLLKECGRTGEWPKNHSHEVDREVSMLLHRMLPKFVIADVCTILEMLGRD